MFSLFKIATFASLAFGTFSFAAPTIGDGFASLQRRTAAQQLETILQSSIPGLVAASQPLYTINSGNATTATIATITAQINVQLGALIKNSSVFPKDGTVLELDDIDTVADDLGNIIDTIVKSTYSAYTSLGSSEALLIGLILTEDGLLASLVNEVAGLLTGPTAWLKEQLLNLIGTALLGFPVRDPPLMETLGFNATLRASGFTF
ncbi:hypothetical protein OF83DRAFT_1177292 [Amylostereum chailletii]|nr:hypothetical protein OF83DRAFT_1177292 [Amylostereum chailletii]